MGGALRCGLPDAPRFLNRAALWRPIVIIGLWNTSYPLPPSFPVPLLVLPRVTSQMDGLHSFDLLSLGLLLGKRPGEAMPFTVLQLGLDGGSLSRLTCGLHVCLHAMVVISLGLL